MFLVMCNRITSLGVALSVIMFKVCHAPPHPSLGPFCCCSWLAWEVRIRLDARIEIREAYTHGKKFISLVSSLFSQKAFYLSLSHSLSLSLSLSLY